MLLTGLVVNLQRIVCLLGKSLTQALNGPQAAVGMVHADMAGGG